MFRRKKITVKTKFIDEINATINVKPALLMDTSFPYNIVLSANSIVIQLQTNFKVPMSDKYFKIHENSEK